MIRPAAACVLAAALAGAARAGESQPAPWAFACSGNVVHATSLSFLGLSLRDISARPVMADGRLSFEQLSASGYGGRITGEISVIAGAESGSPARFAGELSVSGVDFVSYLRSLGLSADQIGGTVSGWVRFALPEGRIDEMTGEGELRIDQANLIQFNWLQNLIAGEVGGSRGQDQARVRFELGPDPETGKGRIRIVQAMLTSPSVEVVASGTMDYEWRLDVLLQASPEGGILKQTIGWAFGRLFSPLTATIRNLLTYRVRGRITDPIFILRPFGN